jgi:hypothetical protein
MGHDTLALHLRASSSRSWTVVSSFAFGCPPDQCIYIQRLGNQHFAGPKARLHRRRNVYNFGLLHALKLFAPRRSAGEF